MKIGNNLAHFFKFLLFPESYLGKGNYQNLEKCM